VAPDEVVLACRLSGVSVDDLWLRYLEVGGSRSRGELASRLGGVAWPEPEDRYLAVVADEALRDSGLPRLVTPEFRTAPRPCGGSPGGQDERSPYRTPGNVLATRALGTRLSRLFEQCARTRASARGVRQYAQSVRRTGPVHGDPSAGSP